MAAIGAAGLAGRVRIELASYDAPVARRFDLIYGIESLIHSADPAATVANLAGALRPGGTLVIVDDMPAEAMPDEARARLSGFRRFWRCPVAPGRAGWRKAMEAAGLFITHERDLTPLLRVRAMAEAAPHLAELQGGWRFRLGLDVRAEAEVGGILLETLQTDGWVQYRLMTAQAP
jgi:SAM-dependent methyltransferase